MGTGAELAVQGYIELGQWLVNTWGARALDVASQIDNGTLTADAVVGDVNAAAFLALQSFGLIVNEAFDAAAVLSGEQDQPRQVTSSLFSTVDSASPLTLQLVGDLIADFQDDSIPQQSVTFDQNPIGPHVAQFRLVATVTAHRSEGYSGTVNVSDSNGLHVDTVPVWIAV